MRVFKYQPEGRSTPADKIGFGTVVPGELYPATDEQAAQLEQDGEFKEIRGKQAAAVLADLEQPDPQPDQPEAQPDAAVPDQPAEGKETT